jgi:hypothetical protein
MCGPAAPLIAAGMSAAGTLIGGVMANQQGKYEHALGMQNAKIADEQARDSVLRGREEARDFFRQAAQIKGQQIASMAANGIDLGFGSAARIQQDTAATVSEDAQDLYFNADQRTNSFHVEAINRRAEASAAKYRGKQALIGSLFQAGSTLASGFGKMEELKANRLPPDSQDPSKKSRKGS